MARFGQRAPSVAETSRYVPTPRPLQVLRADGARIDLTSKDAGQHLIATKQPWQQSALAYRDLIGELRYSNRLLAQGVAQVRFYVAQSKPWPEDPTPLDGEDHDVDSQLAADAIHNFSILPLDSSPDGFTARFTDNLATTGEVWLHMDPEERVHVRSISEVTATPDGKVMLATVPNGNAASQRQLDPQNEALLRCWRPHLEWAQLADCAMRSLLDVCEDVVLAGREARAAARSRVAANGILLIPQELTLLASRDEEDDDDLPVDTFMQDFTEAMTAPIRDDGDAGAVVPIIIKGAGEDLEKVKHLTLQRADAEALIERQSSALLRLLKGLDVQPEQVNGVGAANHWSGWLVEAQSIKHQISPMAQTVAACLTAAFLRPALLSLGHDPKAVAQVTIAVDVSPLSENPNRTQDARDAHAAGVISDAKFREALGFDDDDAPDDEEKLQRLAASGKLPVGVTAALFGLSQQDAAKAAVIEGQIAEATDDPAAPKALPTGKRPAVVPGETVPARPMPEQPTGPIVASAAIDGWRVDVETARRLADIDAALAEKIAVACDAALARVLEKAGARVRSAAQKDRAVAASLAGLDAHLVPAVLGRSQVETFAPLDELLADGYTRLQGQFRRWMGDAAQSVASVVLELLGLDPRSEQAGKVRDQVTSRLGRRIDPAWDLLSHTLDEVAERAMFTPDPLAPRHPERGEEASDTIISPREVSEVLRVAGGTPPRATTAHQAPMRATTPGPGGYGTGPDVTGLLEEHGAVLLGWEWQYRAIEIPRSAPFAPWHTSLDKVRFGTFTDPKLDTEAATAWIGPYYFPQDHDGCQCRAVPVLAAPELDDESGGDIVEQRLRKARERYRRHDEVAADDDAAGRVGTSLQQEREVRDRLTDGIAELRRRYIEEDRK